MKACVHCGYVPAEEDPLGNPRDLPWQHEPDCPNYVPMWEGHVNRECGEHRTTGFRAWCHDCSEWCYPESPCVRCERPMLIARLLEVGLQLKAMQERVREALEAAGADVKALDTDARPTRLRKRSPWTLEVGDV